MAKKSESKQDTAKLEKALDTVCELLTKRYELCPDQQKNKTCPAGSCASCWREYLEGGK